MMNTLELIRTRRSVRTFDGRAIRPEDSQKIMDFAEKVGNPYDIPITWKLLDGTRSSLSSPVIVGTDTFIAGKLHRVPHAEEAFGYSFEKIGLFAQSLGVGTTWIAGTMNRAAFERAMELGEDEVMPCVSPLGYPAEKMSFREKMMRRGIKADTRFDFSDLFFDGEPGLPLTGEKAGALKDAFEAVRLAPSAVNKQPWRAVLDGQNVHFYEKRSAGYVSENGWDVQKIDMGIALCHFELAARECGMDVSFDLGYPGRSAGEDMTYVASYTIRGEQKPV